MKFLISVLMMMSAHAFATEYNCGGTEPFWDLTANPTSLTFNYDAKKVVIGHPRIGTAVGVTDVFTITGQAGQTSITAFVNTATDNQIADVHGNAPPNAERYKSYCSDGMSDKLYPYTINILVNGKAFTGCCATQENSAVGNP